MTEDSDFEFSGDEIEEKKHAKLVFDVLNLNKVQSIKKASRTEPSKEVSEFNLYKSLSNKRGSLHTNELANSLKNYKKNLEISRIVKGGNKKIKTLPKPLPKTQTEQIKRSLNYERSRLQLDRWEALVASQQAATDLYFPLDSVEKLKIVDKQSESYPSTWRLKSDLQKELAKMVNEESYKHITDEKRESETFLLTLKELEEKRKESRKLRAHRGYKETKARKQNKIKSKKYHRILKRDRIKQKLKEFEELQKTDLEEAVKKLEDIDKARVQERFSLRHKGTGRWAKSKQVRAKYDKESRQVLAQQLAISRELTQKLKSNKSESDEEKNESENKTNMIFDKNNPWTNNLKTDKEVEDFVNRYRKYWNQNNKEPVDIEKITEIESADDVSAVCEASKTLKVKGRIKKGNTIVGSGKIKKQEKANMSLSTSEGQWTNKCGSLESNGNLEYMFSRLEGNIEKKLKKKYKTVLGQVRKEKQHHVSTAKQQKMNKTNLTMPGKSKKVIIDEELMEQAKKANDMSSELNELKQILRNESTEETPDINPAQFIGCKETALSSAIPDILHTDGNDENPNQRGMIIEAFKDDDIANNFEKEKAETVEQDTPNDINLNLPGWGYWAGNNTNSRNRKQKHLILKMPPVMPRKDHHKKSLIIKERTESKMKALLVLEVPFPFKSVKDYEASIRAPIGSTFVPEIAFRRLIQPEVRTKMGAVIEPMNKSYLLSKK